MFYKEDLDLVFFLVKEWIGFPLALSKTHNFKLDLMSLNRVYTNIIKTKYGVLSINVSKATSKSLFFRSSINSYNNNGHEFYSHTISFEECDNYIKFGFESYNDFRIVILLNAMFYYKTVDGISNFSGELQKNVTLLSYC